MGHAKKLMLRSLLKGKVIKYVLIGLLGILVILSIMLIIVIKLAINYYPQIYAGLLSAVNYIFGNTPENLLKEMINAMANGFLRNLFSQ